MCFSRPRHHIEEEKRRDAAERQRAEQAAEQLRKEQEKRIQESQKQAAEQQTQVMQTIAEAIKQPMRVKTTADAVTPLLRTRQKAPKTAKGVASLRINRTPGTNIGLGDSGTNIG